MSWERIQVLLRKEFLQVWRDPRSRLLLIVPPIVQLVIFGYAANLDVDNARLGWMDMDRTSASRELRSRFEGSGRFNVIAEPSSEMDVQRLLDRGQVDAIIRILPGFGSDQARQRRAQVQVIVDGTNSNAASIVSSYATGVLAIYAKVVASAQQNARKIAGTPSSPRAEFAQIVPESRVWFNPELRSRNYFVPGVIVNIIMMVTLMLTALAIVREKEIGTIEQLMVTPLQPAELIIGKTLPFVVVGIVDMVLVSAVALLVFHIPFRGSFLLLVLCTLLFLMSTLGAGLFLSTISRTQQQAVMSSFFFSMPAFMLSGFTFPIRNMPEAVAYLTYLNPLRYFMNIVRGIYLKGVGIEVLWPEMVCLAVYGAVVLGLSATRFRKTLD